MKKKASLISAAILLICCLFLAGCSSDTYTSSYKAVGLTQTYDDDSAEMTFSEFQGTKVYKLKFSGKNDKTLKYNLKLEVGSATIYYDTEGKKKELVSLKSGDRVEDKFKDITYDSIYIIIETNEKCLNGAFSFETKSY
ncbi:MAG: hypothetical protein IJU82_03875 [Ruminiclostridium sp.]|nr:hypothetical protein [Ruminiclostridium sp.]